MGVKSYVWIPILGLFFLLVYINPLHRSDLQIIQKTCYKGKFNLAISNYSAAGENYYEALKLMEKSLPPPQSDRTNEEYKAALKIRNHLFPDVLAEEIYLSLAFAHYRQGLHQHAKRYSQQALKKWGDNLHVQRMDWLVDRAQGRHRPPPEENEKQDFLARLKIYPMIREEFRKINPP